MKYFPVLHFLNFLVDPQRLGKNHSVTSSIENFLFFFTIIFLLSRQVEISSSLQIGFFSIPLPNCSPVFTKKNMIVVFCFLLDLFCFSNEFTLPDQLLNAHFALCIERSKFITSFFAWDSFEIFIIDFKA